MTCGRKTASGTVVSWFRRFEEETFGRAFRRGQETRTELGQGIRAELTAGRIALNVFEGCSTGLVGQITMAGGPTVMNGFSDHWNGLS